MYNQFAKYTWRTITTIALISTGRQMLPKKVVGVAESKDVGAPIILPSKRNHLLFDKGIINVHHTGGPLNSHVFYSFSPIEFSHNEPCVEQRLPRLFSL